jgi:hypothetical protein
MTDTVVTVEVDLPNAYVPPVPLVRRHDWQLQHELFARQRARQPFAWGSNDCATFAADYVQAITGVDVAPDLRGYQTALEAGRVLEAQRAQTRAGLYTNGLFALATAKLGEPMPPTLAAVGDVVLLMQDDVPKHRSHMLGVCNGTTAMGPGRLGILHVGMHLAIAAWKVGGTHG